MTICLQTPRPKKRHIETMLPLINLVFLLLVFFLYAGTLLPQEAREITPALSVEQEAGQLENVIYINADGEISYQGQVLDLQNLPRLEANEVTIFADYKLSANKLISVLETLKQNEIPGFKLITRRENSGESL